MAGAKLLILFLSIILSVARAQEGQTEGQMENGASSAAPTTFFAVLATVGVLALCNVDFSSSSPAKPAVVDLASEDDCKPQADDPVEISPMKVVNRRMRRALRKASLAKPIEQQVEPAATEQALPVEVETASEQAVASSEESFDEPSSNDASSDSTEQSLVVEAPPPPPVNMPATTQEVVTPVTQAPKLPDPQVGNWHPFRSKVNPLLSPQRVSIVNPATGRAITLGSRGNARNEQTHAPSEPAPVQPTQSSPQSRVVLAAICGNAVNYRTKLGLGAPEQEQQPLGPTGEELIYYNAQCREWRRVDTAAAYQFVVSVVAQSAPPLVA